jgi:aspartyl-tRNA(Asn)/glutamyl-tRNA(Gln) amidotransferase subunit A
VRSWSPDAPTATRRRPRATSTEALSGIFLARPQAPRPGRALAVKDLFDTAGLGTTYGSAVFVDHVPKRSAEAVLRLEGAGWANVGKTNLHEFAYGITSQNPHYGTVPNPIAPGRVAGGSSGGSAAALAAGLCEGALGTDSGGSIRIPAAWCGTVGLKPSFGLVPIEGCYPLAPSFDHAGPMARDVATCAELLAGLVPGFAPRSLESLSDLRIGVAGGLGLGLGERVELPSAAGVAPVFMREVAVTHERTFREHRELYGANVAAKVERCLAVSDAEYERALARRDELRAAYAALFADLDLLLTPTVPIPAPPADVDELEVRERAISFTFPFNAVGAPALAVPWRRGAAGPPASLQLVAAPGEDALVLGAAALFEARLAQRP